MKRLSFLFCISFLLIGSCSAQEQKQEKELSSSEIAYLATTYVLSNTSVRYSLAGATELLNTALKYEDMDAFLYKKNLKVSISHIIFAVTCFGLSRLCIKTLNKKEVSKKLAYKIEKAGYFTGVLSYVLAHYHDGLGYFLQKVLDCY